MVNENVPTGNPDTDDTTVDPGMAKPPSVQTYRSMQSDLVDIARDENTSLASMILANESRKRERYRKETATWSKSSASSPLRAAAIAVLALLGLAFASLGGFALYDRFQPSATPQQAVPSLVYADQQVGVGFNPLTSRTDFYAEIRNVRELVNLNSEEVVHVYFDVAGNGRKGPVLEPPCRDLVTYAADSAPGYVVSAFDDSVCMFGWYSLDGQETEPFFLVRVRDHDVVLGHMLRWEDSMVESLREWFDLPLKRERDAFVDTTVEGVDARGLYAEDGTPLIYWGVTKANYLFITTSHGSSAELIARLTLSGT